MIALTLALLVGADPSAWMRAAQDAFLKADWGVADHFYSRAQEDALLVDDRSTLLAAKLGRVDLRLVAREPDSALSVLPGTPGVGISADDSILWWSARARVLQAKGSDPRESIETALAIARKTGRRPLKDWCLLVRARIRTQRGDFAGAASDLDEVGAKGSRILELRLFQSKAALELARGNAREALDLVVKASDIARERGDVSSMVDLLPLRAKAEEGVGEFGAAKVSWQTQRSTALATGLDHQAREAREALERLDKGAH
jgi:hypothetical protein